MGKTKFNLNRVNSNKISAVVMTHNSANIVSESLKSLKWCNEVIVIDDDSSDRSREVAKKFGAKVFKRGMKGDFAAQRNFAYKVTKNNWLFFVDSDEIVTNEIKLEILRYLKSGEDISAFWMRKEDYFLGNLLKHGPAGYAYFGRLLRKDRTRWVGEIFEYPEVDGKSVYLKERLIHRRQEGVAEMVVKANFYSDLEAQMLYNRGENASLWKILSDPITRFNQYYWGKKAFLDGMAGFIFVILGSVLVKFLGQIKLWAKWNSR